VQRLLGANRGWGSSRGRRCRPPRAARRATERLNRRQPARNIGRATEDATRSGHLGVRIFGVLQKIRRQTPCPFSCKPPPSAWHVGWVMPVGSRQVPAAASAAGGCLFQGRAEPAGTVAGRRDARHSGAAAAAVASAAVPPRVRASGDHLSAWMGRSTRSGHDRTPDLCARCVPGSTSVRRARPSGLGYFRVGASVTVRGASAGNEGCAAGWFTVAPRLRVRRRRRDPG
jgi:hypothetical protein